MHLRRWGMIVFLATSILVGGCGEPTVTGPKAKDIRLAGLFSDHCVLQRNREIPVWGWAEPGGILTVTLNGKTVQTKTNKKGKWTANLPAMKAGGPYRLTVTGEKTTTLSDVLIGDVWICSGQSNMEFGMGSSLNATEETKQANYPLLRHIKVGKLTSPTPKNDVTGNWITASPKTVRGFTAVGYFFGRDLHTHLNVPIGLINTSWGGTRVEAWTSREVLASLPGTKTDLQRLDSLKGNLQEMRREYEKKFATYKASYSKLEALETNQHHLKTYSDPALDDSNWKPIPIPGNWEANGHPGLDGEVWYRKTVTIPANWAGKDLALELGPIDEVDTTYFNGEKIGGLGSVKPLNTDHWNVPRHYTIPGRLVKSGEALIAIRIIDQCGQGGPWGGNAEDIFLAPVQTKADKKARLSLSGPWKHHVTLTLLKKPTPPTSPNTATVLFNGMVNGLIPYGIKGAIWYQGESNAGNAYAYRVRFPAMITDWRARWSQGNFPFLWVQLANFKSAPTQPQNSSWAVVRESQDLTLALPNTGTGLAIDIGNAKDIHPRNKQDVGKRLALAARHVAYGESLVYSGPMYKNMKLESQKIRLTFTHVGGGLIAKDGPLKQFAIAGIDGKFVWANAVLDGNTVVVSAEEVKAPVAVRYAWADNPAGCNLTNLEGLPASPFRTDNWPVATQPKN